MKVETQQPGIYTMDFFGEDVLLAFSGREFGAGRRNDFLDHLGIKEDQLALLRQVHATNLVLVTPESIPHGNCDADGMITSSPGIALGVLTADCVPIFLWDPSRRAIGIAHAGWRGVYDGIPSKIVKAFRQNFMSKPEDIKIALGPAIHKCCYAVGEEFSDFFPEFFIPDQADQKSEGPSSDVRGHMDLIGAVLAGLAGAGILKENIAQSGICTSCQNGSFFSHRCDENNQERILSVIQIRNSKRSIQ